MTTVVPCRAQDPHTCPYHGAQLRADDALTRGDKDAYIAAQAQMTAAIATTPEIIEYFRSPHTYTVAGPLTGGSTPVTPKRAVTAARLATEEATSPKATKPAGPFTVPARSTYAPAPSHTIPNSYGRGYRGGKVADNWRSVTDIAKDVRADLKEAQAKGYLPKNLTYAVNTEKYAGGQSLRVSIQGGTNTNIYKTGTSQLGRRDMTDQAREIENRVSTIVGQYHYDDSNPQTDSFHTNFYYQVNVEDDSAREGREAEKRRLARMREANAHRNQLRDEVRASGDERAYFESKYKFETSTADNTAQLSLIDSATPMVVIRYQRPTSAHPRYDVYDFSKTVAPDTDRAALLKTLAGKDSYTFRQRYRRYRVVL